MTEKQMVAVLEASCKPMAKFAIGVEHEHFLFYINYNNPVSYYDRPQNPEPTRYGIRTILNDLSKQANWRLIIEDGNPIAAEKDGDHITLEPGGQMELALKPMRSVAELCAHLLDRWLDIQEVAVPRNIGFLHLGFAPWALRKMPRVPKQRYRLMRRVMPHTGHHGLDMMHRTTSIQVSLDYSSEADMVKKFRLANLLQPFIITWFGNSPHLNSRRNYLSFRTRCWEQTDPARCWYIPEVFDDDFGFKKYAAFAMKVPMYFIVRDGNYINARGSMFADFIADKAPPLKGYSATVADWKTHLSTIFTQSRLRNYLEIRGCDGGSFKNCAALIAFLVGIFYDDEALDTAYTNLMRIVDAEKLGRFSLDAARRGWKVRLNRSHTIGDYSETLVALARGGLHRRSTKMKLNPHREFAYLDHLEQAVKKQESPAQRVVKSVEISGRRWQTLFRNGDFVFF